MDVEMLDTEVTHGTLAALHEDALTSDKGCRVQALEHLGNDREIVPMSPRGDAQLIPVRPWVTGDHQNDARPLNMATIHGLVRATGEVPCPAVQRQYALRHKNVTVVAEGESNRIRVDIAPDHDAPAGMRAADHGLGGQRARAQGLSSCRTDADSTWAWTESICPASR